MKIIIPMAGMGKRMRPHTLSIPKPLIPIAGKSIVQRLVEGISGLADEKIEEIAFIIGDFGKETEKTLVEIAENVGSIGKIYYQKDPLGTAHAILCAEDSLNEKTIVAFADTLFRANFKLDKEKDGIIWVNKVDDPSSFGVVKVDSNNKINDFIEKPKSFISDLAIIGIYYFKNGENLKKELKYLIENNIHKGGEYQLTDALQNMMKKGVSFYTDVVDEWLDCGNKNATVYTNQRVLLNENSENLVSSSAHIIDSVIKRPCFIGENVKISNSIIGPYVSIGENTSVENSVIVNSIIQSNSKISDLNLENSMIGNHVEYKGSKSDVSIGDFTSITTC
jgi:glucose-1-phosphate thymidylyltransferase